MKSFTFGKRGIAMLSLVASLFVGGTTTAFAQEAYTCGFEAEEGWSEVYESFVYTTTPPSDWGIIGASLKNHRINYLKNTGNSALSCDNTNSEVYVVTPMLAKGKVSFFARRTQSSYQIYVYKASYDEATGTYSLNGTFIDRWYKGGNTLDTSFKEYSVELDEDSYLAIRLSCAAIDDFTAENGLVGTATEGAALKLFDGENKMDSPYEFSFGLTEAGATHSFKLSNPGTEDLNVTVSETGNFNATLSATTIAAGGEATLTVTMPAASGSSEITITPAAEGIEPFVINVTGAVKDPSKSFVNFAGLDDFPEGWGKAEYAFWEITGSGSGTSSNGGYAATTTSSMTRFYTSMMTFEENEPLIVMLANANSYGNGRLQIQTSMDGETWTNVGNEITVANESWEAYTVNMPAGTYMVGFNGAYVYLTDIYGGVEATEFPPVMEVEEKDYDFGFIAENAEYKFTIKNIGKGDLTGLEVTSDNAAFTIAGVPENKTIAAESEIEITVTMVAEGEGAKNGVITISADAYKDENAKKFNVTGIVRNPEVFYEGFDAEPAGWRMEGYSVENGYAKGSYNQGSLVTPSLSFANHNTLSFRAMSTSSSALSFRVFYTTNSQNAANEEWKEIEGIEPLSTFNKWETYTLNMPAEAKYVAFSGEYINIDDVYGGELLKQTLTLDQTVAPEALAEGMCDVTLNYTIAEGKWGTIALPFAVEDLSVLGDVKAYAFTGYENGNIKLDVTTTMEAGKPYVIYANAAISEAIELNDVNITATEAAAVEFNGAKFQATYAPLAAGSMEGKYGVAPTGKIQKGSAKASMKGFRGFFELPANAQNARLLINGEEVTGIETIENAESADVVFDLQGRRVAQPTKGLYIIGGKKMMVK